MSESKFIFRIAELSRVRIQCPDCAAEIVIRADRALTLEPACPNCRRKFEGLARMLNDYAEFYKQAQRADYDVRLETAPESEAAPPPGGKGVK